jgi:hypothetical protein
VTEGDSTVSSGSNHGILTKLSGAIVDRSGGCRSNCNRLSGSRLLCFAVGQVLIQKNQNAFSRFFSVFLADLARD